MARFEFHNNIRIHDRVLLSGANAISLSAAGDIVFESEAALAVDPVTDPSSHKEPRHVGGYLPQPDPKGELSFLLQ